jgi:type VI secretion system Hcp family effector
MAYEFYVTIEGTKQGKFKGESPREAHTAKIAGLGMSHEIQSPRDLATGKPSGKVQHGQIKFLKEWGAASPQLFHAMVENEVLKSVLFEFFKTKPTGEEYVYHTITLEEATVARIEYSTGRGTGEGTAKHGAAYDTHEVEQVGLTYRKIVHENKDGQTMGEDDWYK